MILKLLLVASLLALGYGGKEDIKAVKAAALDSYDVKLAPYRVVIDSRGGIAYRRAWRYVDAALSSLVAEEAVQQTEIAAVGCVLKGAS